MAKIKVTENELKEIISESVKSMINEYKWDKYGTPWNMLSGREKENYAYYYANKYRAWKTDGKGNYIYQNGKAVPDYDKLEQIYNQEQEKYQHKGNRGQYSQGHVEKLNQQADSLNKLYKQIGPNINNYNDAASALMQQQENLKTYQTNLTALYAAAGIGRTPAPNQETAIKNITNWKRAASQWYAYQKQLKAQQTTQPQAQTAQPAQQQTSQPQTPVSA